MKFYLVFAAALGLAACTGPTVEEPALPEGAATVAFSFTDDSFLRGVSGSYNTTPAGRSAAILDVTYEMTCLADNALARVAQAQTLLDERYVIANHLYFNNPQEQGWWRRDASRLVEPTGCIVDKLSFVSRTTDPVETGMYLLRNMPRTSRK